MAFSRYQVQNFYTSVLSADWTLEPGVDGELPIASVPAYIEEGKIFFVVFNVTNVLERVIIPVYMNAGAVAYHGYDIPEQIVLQRYDTVAINDVAHLFDELYALVDDFGVVVDRGGLSIMVYGGDAVIAGITYTIPDTVLTLADNTINYIIVNAVTHAIEKRATEPVDGIDYLLGEVTTVGGDITLIQGRRGYMISDNGPIGPQGYQGSQGYQGYQGPPDGNQGDQGYQGDKGDQGDITGNGLFEIAILSDIEPVLVGNNVAKVVVPAEYDGYKLDSANSYVFINGTALGAGVVNRIQIKNVTKAVDMLSTQITIDGGTLNSYVAATPSVVNGANATVNTGDIISINVMAVVNDVVSQKGLGVILVFSLT